MGLPVLDVPVASGIVAVAIVFSFRFENAPGHPQGSLARSVCQPKLGLTLLTS
jgi:hypothetical protein